MMPKENAYRPMKLSMWSEEKSGMVRTPGSSLQSSPTPDVCSNDTELPCDLDEFLRARGTRMLETLQEEPAQGTKQAFTITVVGLLKGGVNSHVRKLSRKARLTDLVHSTRGHETIPSLVGFVDHHSEAAFDQFPANHLSLLTAIDHAMK
jgi:hypothetical protein